MLLVLQNEVCPYCGGVNSGCAIEVDDVSGIESSRITESSFIDQFLERTNPRPTFFFYKNVCNRKEKSKK